MLFRKLLIISEDHHGVPQPGEGDDGEECPLLTSVQGLMVGSGT